MFFSGDHLEYKAPESTSGLYKRWASEQEFSAIFGVVYSPLIQLLV